MKKAIAVFVLFLGLQGAFWWETNDILPDMGIVPDVPGKDTVKAISLGDEQAFFRLLALRIQNAGDTFGRFTALYKYDFSKLYQWFRLLDSLDDESNYIPSMATYYFSQSQNKADVKYIVDYLQEHSLHRIPQKWWWTVQAVYLANHKLEDKELSLKIANHLIGQKDIPIWAQQMPAFIHEQRGELGEALAIIQGILEDPDQLKPGEFNFVKHFIDDRLGKMKEVESQIKAIEEDRVKRGIPLMPGDDSAVTEGEADAPADPTQEPAPAP